MIPGHIVIILLQYYFITAIKLTQIFILPVRIPACHRLAARRKRVDITININIKTISLTNEQFVQ